MKWNPSFDLRDYFTESEIFSVLDDEYAEVSEETINWMIENLTSEQLIVVEA